MPNSDHLESEELQASIRFQNARSLSEDHTLHAAQNKRSPGDHTWVCRVTEFYHWIKQSCLIQD